MKLVATIEARMTSSRLPGKVLLPVLNRPMLHHLISRLRNVPSLDKIVLATTQNHENDVMGRVQGAAEMVDADVIVEITGDCPIIDPDIVEQVIRTYKHHDADYVSNAHVRSFPDGMDVQVFSLASLTRSADMTSEPLDREHVTLHMRNHPELFRPIHLIAPPSLHWPELGLTLDEPADYELLKRIIEHFGRGNNFSCLEVIQLLRQNSDWVGINRHVVRKGDS
jgi:spore coat polysaccharide biosynthesis protein SpsF